MLRLGRGCRLLRLSVVVYLEHTVARYPVTFGTQFLWTMT